MIAILAALAAAATAPAAEAQVQGNCRLSEADQAWLDESVRAWNYTALNITRVGRKQSIRGVFFDSQCMVVSDTALNGGANSWTATRHDGQVKVPNGPELPVSVTSFAMGGEDAEQFVMSTPSVWRAADKSDNGLGSLEKLMTVVVLHEGTHVAQIPTYGKMIGDLSEKYKLPEDFNDDSIQKRFEGNADLAASVKRETELLFAAADATDLADAKRLAREARAMMIARQKRWYPAEDGYLVPAEDVWLTMEGSAQWAAYRWAVDPNGGNVPPDKVQFRTGRWWTQVQGFALFAALDRLVGDGWRQHAFGDGKKTVLQMLDEAIA